MADSISKISVIMVDGGFRERFHLIDCLNNQTLPRDRYELIWVECFDKIQPDLEAKDNVKFIKLNRVGKPYSMSHCFNEGIRRSIGDLLVIPDADVFVCPDFLEKILAEHERCDDLVMYFRRYDQSEEDSGPVTLDYLQRTCRLKIPANYGGCVTVRKKWMLAVNGYEQHPIFQARNFTGGMDLYTRFRNLGMVIKWHPSEKLYHPWHPDPTLKPIIREKVAAQQECIRRRELSLMRLPYQGLDPRLDSSPDWFPVWLDQWRRTRQPNWRWLLVSAARLGKVGLSMLFSRG
jgi:hypothetical protein